MDLITYLEANYILFTSLPDNLSVGGSLNLRGTSITSLPDNLSVGGSLNLRGTSITSLPDNLSVGGYLNLEGTSITSLPDNFKKNTFIRIKNKGKWDILVSHNTIKIGCKEKESTKWRYFFKNRQYYETDPNSQDYKLIEEDYQEALRVYNYYYFNK